MFIHELSHNSSLLKIIKHFNFMKILCKILNDLKKDVKYAFLYFLMKKQTEQFKLHNQNFDYLQLIRYWASMLCALQRNLQKHTRFNYSLTKICFYFYILGNNLWNAFHYLFIKGKHHIILIWIYKYILNINCYECLNFLFFII